MKVGSWGGGSGGGGGGCNVRGEDRRMFVHAQRPHCVACGRDFPDRIILPDVPQLYLAVPRSADQLPEPTALHVHIGDPLLVLPPTSNHG